MNNFLKRLVFLSLAFAGGVSTGGAGDSADQKAAKIRSVRTQLAILNMAVEAYAADHLGQFPDTLDQLAAKSERGGPYLARAALLDPWDMPYRFDKAGKKHDSERPDIWTKTAAGEVLGNWQNKPVINSLKLQHEVRVIGAQALVDALSKAVDVFALKNNGVFPNKLDDLLEGTKILQKDTLLDPWERPFQYEKEGPRNKGKRPDIWTTVPGTNEKIGNWEDRSKSNPVRQLHDAKVKLARANLSLLTGAVKAYEAEKRKFPVSLNLLTEGKSPFAMEKALFDPWGNPYLYNPDGAFNAGRVPDIWTETPMREQIGNWQKDTKK